MSPRDRSVSGSDRLRFCTYIVRNKFALLTLVLCTTVYFTNQLDRFLNTTSKPDFVTPADNDQISGFLFTITYTLTGVLISLFGSNWNRARVLGLAAIGWSVATALVGITNHFWQVAVLRISVSIFQAACTPFAAALIADEFPPYLKGFALGIYNFGVYTGFGISQGLLVIGKENWHLSWFIFGAVGAVVGLLIWIFLSDSRKKKAKEGDGTEALLQSSINEAEGGSKPKRRCPNASDLARHWLTTPSLWLLSLAGGIRNAGGYVWGYNSKKWFVNAQHVSTDTYSLRMALIPLFAGSGGAILGGYVADKLLKCRRRDGGRCGPTGRVFVMILSNILAAPFAAGALLAPADWNEDLGGFLCLIGSNLLGEMWIGICLALVTELVPKEMRTTSVAIYLFIITNIGGNMPSAVTALANAFSFSDSTKRLRAALLILYPGTYALSSVFFVFLLLIVRRDITKVAEAEGEKKPLTIPNDDGEAPILLAEAGSNSYSLSNDIEGDAPRSKQLRDTLQSDLISNSDL